MTEARRRFFRERFPDFWYDLEGRDYALLDVFAMQRDQVESIRAAARDAWRIFSRVAPVLRALPDDALEAIGIPAQALAICRQTDARLGESFIARFDFALTQRGPKVLELNAETPFLLWESYEIGGAIATALGFEDPNAGQAATLGAALGRAVGSTFDGRMAVTAYNTWREDWFSAAYAARVASEALGRTVDAVPLHELQVLNGTLCDAGGTAIDLLWRLYPLEHFAHDRNAAAFFDLVKRRTVRIINPPSALLLQNKAALAIIWDLAQRELWFDAAERDIIARRFLPTYLDAPSDAATYVRKPVLGREGSAVAIVRAGATLAASPRRQYAGQPMVYQQFVPLRQAHGGSAIATCFIVGGEAGAVAMRVGEAITDINAQFLPIGLQT